MMGRKHQLNEVCRKQLLLVERQALLLTDEAQRWTQPGNLNIFLYILRKGKMQITEGQIYLDIKAL